MPIAVIAFVILFGFAAIASVLLWPFRTVWEAAWAQPERTAKTVLGIVAASMVATWLELPWKFGLVLAGGRASGWEVLHALVLAIGYAGPLVGNLLFLVVWFAVPYTAWVFVKTAWSVSTANAAWFVGRMLLAFLGALFAYGMTGYVPITWALYGIGALLVYRCLQVLR